MATHYHHNQFPPESLVWDKLIPLLGPTRAAIAHYDGVLTAIPNAAILLSPLTTQEAVLSSRIEGTQATMGEVLEYEAAGDTGKYDEHRKADIFEVLNYRSAMREAERLLADLPLSQRLIKQVHEILLSGVRGQSKSPGEYRKIPNWIGPPGCTIDDAFFVPIGSDKLPAGMAAWEKFIHTDYLDSLVQLALLHVEFEALHPFLDGNGRLGRMLVPLFMWQRGIISRPMFYISAIFEQNREDYYTHLRAVSQSGAWTEWCIFFLQAMQKQAEDNTNKAKSILELYDEMKRVIPTLTHSQHAIRAVDWIFNFPIFSSLLFFQKAKIPEPTARRILSLLVEGDILKIVSPASGRRAATYCFPSILNLAEGRQVF